jgi:uncharacterized phiE125 gp8 family phage protein
MRKEICMSSILIAPPAIEPLTLEEAKAYLRVETNDDDLLIGALISAARLQVEAQTQTCLITQMRRLVLDCWPQRGRIAVRPGPLKALTAARVLDFDGHARSVDPQDFVIDSGRSMIAFMPWAMPMPTRIAAGIELDVTIGFGEVAADVPEPLRQTMRLFVAHWYENRGLIVAGTQVATLPASANALLAPYRMLAL